MLPSCEPRRKETYQDGWRDGYRALAILPPYHLFPRPFSYLRGFGDAQNAFARDRAEDKRRAAWNKITGEIDAARPELV